MKNKQLTCRCNAYAFPHRQGGGKCGEVRWLLDVMNLHGYVVDGDEAVEWMSGHDSVFEAVNGWIAELSDWREEAVIRY